jgi:peptide/nickel transport system substrate-binding protein
MNVNLFKNFLMRRRNMRNKLFVLASLVIIASMVLAGCATPTATTAPQPAQPGVTVVVKTVIVTVPGENTVQVVTATPPPAAPAPTFTSKDPTTFVYATIGDMVTMDPALAYDTSSGMTIQNTYETLIFYNKTAAADFIPQLATEVPTKDNGGISADGKSFTFKIRQGVKFHNGDDMTPSDVAYSLQRGLLQSGPDSPQWLLTEPFFGIGMQDMAMVVQAVVDGATPGTPLTADQISKASGTAMVGDPAAVQAVDPKALKASCDWVTSLIVADDAKGTVTLNLAQPWGPLLPTLANTWGSVMDKKWVTENKGWDGSCDTWQNFYGVTAENNPINDIENGTGPYKLSQWNKGQEIDMEAVDNYWRTDPAWEGGPTGAPAIKHAITKIVPEWGTRFAMLQAGDADVADVPRANTSQIMPLVGEQCQFDDKTGDFTGCAPTSTPDQPLLLDKGFYQLAQDSLMFNFAVNTDGGNPYIGSGKLDGKGIPPDFFADVNVRKGFQYCFNWDTFIQQYYLGEAVQSMTLPLPGTPGFSNTMDHYTFDADKCAEAFKASTLKSADGKSLWDTGFRFQLTYNTGNAARLTVAQILQANLAKVNSKFVVEILGTPWPTILNAYQHSRLPAFIIGWQEDIHDAHNWYAPFGPSGTYGRNQNFPPELSKSLIDIENAGVAEVDPAKRAEIYAKYNQIVYDQATQILLAVVTGRHYQQRWVDGWYYNPMIGTNYYFYPLSKK